MHRLLVALVLGFLASCAAKQPVSAADTERAYKELVCDGAQQCADMWKRAQFWVATNAGYKIQVATDTVIETFNAADYSTRWAVRMTKEPLGSGRERIWILLGCGQVSLCAEDRLVVIARAKTYIAAGQ